MHGIGEIRPGVIVRTIWYIIKPEFEIAIINPLIENPKS